MPVEGDLRPDVEGPTHTGAPPAFTGAAAAGLLADGAAAPDAELGGSVTTADEAAGHTGVRVGYIQPGWGGCGPTQANGYERSYYQINVSKYPIPSNADVTSAILTLTQTYGSDNSCTQWPVTVETTGPISSSTTWNNKPGPATGAAAYSHTNWVSSVNGSNCQTPATTTFQMQSVLDAFRSGTLTIGVHGQEDTSSTNYGHMRFATNPSIQVTYDLPPTVSAANTTPPATVVNATNGTVANSANGAACNTGDTPGWMGLTSSSHGASSIHMNSTATSPISGTTLAIWYSMHDLMANDGTGAAKQVTYGHVDYAATPRYGDFAMTTTVTDGHEYTWNTQASDSIMSSNTIDNCEFKVDLTPPTSSVTSTDFPASGSNQPSKYAGQSGTFSLTGTDPAPKAGTCTLAACLPASGLAGFRWSLDQPIPTSGFNWVKAVSGTASLPITPSTWGSHTLYVQAVDFAGNAQTTPVTYKFYAPWNSSQTAVAGDVNDDRVPDMLATNTSNNLLLLPGNADPSTAAKTISTQAQSPDGTSWSNYLIAHRGSFTGQPVDDLIAYNKTTKNLYIYANDKAKGGTAGSFTNQAGVIPVAHPQSCTFAAPRCDGYPSDWSHVTQIAAPGDVFQSGGSPDLLTVENNQLWLYQGGSGGLSSPVLLGDGDWSNMTLITPGIVDGNPTLWVRDNLSGALYTYNLAVANTNEYLPPLIHAPVRAQLTSAEVNSSSVHMCAEANNASTTNGTPVQVWACSTSYNAAQHWTPAADGSLRMRGACMDITNGTIATGTPIQIYTCNGAQAQKWVPGANGSLVVKSTAGTGTPLCLTDPGGSTTNGTQLKLAACDNLADQDFTSQTASGWHDHPATALGLTLDASQYPTVTSPGDLNSPGGTGSPDGYPDLYAVDSAGNLTEFAGGAPNGQGQLPGNPVYWWNLADSDGTKAGDQGISGTPNPMYFNSDFTPSPDGTGPVYSTATGNPGPTLDNDTNLPIADPDENAAGNPTGKLLTFDGLNAFTATQATYNIDTSNSYTLSAWVKLNSLGSSDEYALGQGTVNHQSFYFGYTAATKAWQFQTTTTDDANTQWDTATSAANTAVAGQWTHLVGTFTLNRDITGNITSGIMRLFVNGALAATATNTSPVYEASSSLTIGAVANYTIDTNNNIALSGPYNQFNGAIADVRVYDRAIGQDATLNTTGSTIGTIASTITNLN